MIIALLIIIALALAVPSIGKPLLMIAMFPVCIAIDIILFPFRLIYHVWTAIFN
jgi:hypothetical protein